MTDDDLRLPPGFAMGLLDRAIIHLAQATAALAASCPEEGEDGAAPPKIRAWWDEMGTIALQLERLCWLADWADGAALASAVGAFIDAGPDEDDDAGIAAAWFVDLERRARTIEVAAWARWPDTDEEE
jgi:hypothetical protein